jgi:DNA-binding transcriptional regulator YhcF (GntR family)
MKQKLTKRSTGFTQVSNNILQDNNISLKAKGLFAYLYSKPDDWDFSHKRIALDMKESPNTIAKILKELEKLGFLVRKKEKTGRMLYYITFEPDTKNAKVAKCQGGKIGTISNIDINTNKEVNTLLQKQVLPKGNSPNGKEKKEKINSKEIPMDLIGFIEWTSKSKQGHVRFIGDWAKAVKPAFTNKAQWEVYLKRNLRASKEAILFEEGNIQDAFQQILKDSNDMTKFKPTIETLVKYLTK